MSGEVSCHLRPVHADVEVLSIMVPLGQNKGLGLLSRDHHLPALGPAGQDVGGLLRSGSRQFEGAAGAEGRGIIGLHIYRSARHTPQLLHEVSRPQRIQGRRQDRALWEACAEGPL